MISPRTLIANDGKLSLADIVATTLRQNISWRVYGPNKEYRRPMFHKYPCKSGQTGYDILVDSVTSNNALYRALVRKGKS